MLFHYGFRIQWSKLLMPRILLINFLVVIDSIHICLKRNFILFYCFKDILLDGINKRNLQILKFLFQKYSHHIFISRIMINIPDRLVLADGINHSVLWFFSNWKIESFSLCRLNSCCIWLLRWLILCLSLLVGDAIISLSWTESVLFDCSGDDFKFWLIFYNCVKLWSLFYLF